MGVFGRKLVWCWIVCGCVFLVAYLLIRVPKTNLSTLKLNPAPLCSQADIERRSSTVVLTTTNAAFLDLTENMLESIKRTRACPNITVVAEDERSYQQLTERMKSQPGLRVQKTDVGFMTSQRLLINSPIYNQLVNRRPRYVLRFLEMGYNVLFVDGDTFWFQDPFRDFHGDFDIAMHNEKATPSVAFCDGLAYYRATENTIRFVRRWVFMLEINKKNQKVQDQSIMNRLISQEESPGLKVKILDPGDYPDGKLYFLTKDWRKENNDPIVLHLSFVLGHDEKVNTLKEFGWWLI